MLRNVGIETIIFVLALGLVAVWLSADILTSPGSDFVINNKKYKEPKQYDCAPNRPESLTADKEPANNRSSDHDEMQQQQ